jgi:hypothetical protein
MPVCVCVCVCVCVRFRVSAALILYLTCMQRSCKHCVTGGLPQIPRRTVWSTSLVGLRINIFQDLHKANYSGSGSIVSEHGLVYLYGKCTSSGGDSDL